MKIKYLVVLLLLFMASCSKKSAPEKAPAAAPAKLPATYKFPKVLNVPDAAATKKPDGRLYYDLMGHRYWKNYKDGKYYLFNKKMYNDPAFKPDYKSKKLF